VTSGDGTLSFGAAARHTHGFGRVVPSKVPSQRGGASSSGSWGRHALAGAGAMNRRAGLGQDEQGRSRAGEGPPRSGASLLTGLRRVEERAHRRLEEVIARASGIPVDKATVNVRVQFVVLFAAIYGLSDADTTTVGTAATQLRHSLSLSNFQLGTLVAVGTAVGAVTTLPAGALADKVKRVPLLAWSVAFWALAMALSAAASSYWMLLATRVLLGGLLAVNGPVTASLLGDLWPAPERGHIYGLITSGELLGAGLGFFASGELAAISWRLSFVVLALPALLIAWKTSHLPEPERMLQRMSAASPAGLATSWRAGKGGPGEELAPPLPEGAGAMSPQAFRDAEMSSGGFWHVVSYVLSIKTNVVLIVAGGFTWMFLSAVESFGEEFVKEEYHIGQVLATVVLLVVGTGAVVGASIGGQSADLLVKRGWRAGRMTVAAGASLLSAFALVPALLTGDLLVGLPLLVIAAGGLAAANPPIDATRIEVVRSSVWGRAEAVRSVLRMGFQAVAPITVGFVADSVGAGGRVGLQAALLILVALLVLAGALLVAGHLTYPGDRVRAVEVEVVVLPAAPVRSL
jgi:MFS family permease